MRCWRVASSSCSLLSKGLQLLCHPRQCEGLSIRARAGEADAIYTFLTYDPSFWGFPPLYPWITLQLRAELPKQPGVHLAKRGLVCSEINVPVACCHRQPRTASLPVPPLTWDGDDKARVTELLKGLSEWPGCSCTYPMVKGVSTCISVIPWLCQAGPSDLGRGLAPGHQLVMQDCCAVSSSADSGTGERGPAG